MDRQTVKQKRKPKNMPNCIWIFRALAVEEEKNRQNEVSLGFYETKWSIFTMDGLWERRKEFLLGFCHM